MKHEVIHEFLEAASPFLIRQLLLASFVMVAALTLAALLRLKTRAGARSNLLFITMLLALSPLPLLSPPVNAALGRVIEAFRSETGPAGPSVPGGDATVITELPRRVTESEIVCVAAVSWLVMSLLSLLIMMGRSVRAHQALRFAGERDSRSEALVRDTLPGGREGAVTVLVSDQATTPALLGVWRVRILMPLSVRDMTVEQLHSLLLHELAHMKRGDNLRDVARLLFTAAYWFHPVAWALNASHNRAREEACDEFVVDTSDGLTSYLDAITLLARPMISADLHGLSCFGSSHLASRMRNLVQYNSRRSNLMRTRNVVAAVFVASLFVFSGASYLAEAAAPYPAQERSALPPYTMTAKVIPGAPGAFTCDLEITELSTGSVVSAARVTTTAGQRATVVSDDQSRGHRFRTKVDVNADGTGTFFLNVTENGVTVQQLFLTSKTGEPSTMGAGNDGEPVTFRLRDAKLQDVLRKFGQLTNYTIVVDPAIDGRVSVDLTNEPWKRALASILSQNGLRYELQGDVIRIVRNDESPSTWTAAAESVRPPQVLTRVEAEYTPEAAAARVAGMVIVRVEIDESGMLTGAKVLKGLPFGLDRSALDAVRSWTFSPAVDRNGLPVRATRNVVMRFTPDGSTSTRK